MLETLANLLIYVPPLLFSVIFHEVAHAWVADKLGDATARKAGRISLNPLVHIDPFMTVILPTILVMSGSPIIFGAAKPVPVNINRFKNIRYAMLLVSAAGPLANFLLAFLCLVAARWIQHFFLNSDINLTHSTYLLFLFLSWIFNGFLINIALGIFNLIPIPPLDGSKILSCLLPSKYLHIYDKIERYGFFILISVLYLKILDPIFESIFKYCESMLRI